MDDLKERIDEYNGRQEKGTGGLFALLLLIVVAILVSYISNNHLIKVIVDGDSMYPTLKDNEVITVSILDKPDYGDIIVIKDELENEWIVKRVIAKAGDTVKIENGKVYLRKAEENVFLELQEEYLDETVKTYPADYSESETYEVLENEIFYLGDNRLVSDDSRGHFGTCEESQVVGVVKQSMLWLRPIDRFIFKLFGKI